MGCCESDARVYKNKYKEKDKGITELHEHMLIYSSFYWREYKDEGFVCNQCNQNIYNNGCFHCRRCFYSLCSKCFYDSGGEISNEYQVSQKGQISNHKHILTFLDANSRNIPITSNPTFKCHICKGIFLMEYAESWNCIRCGLDICEKCFKENKGEIIR